MRGDNVNGVVLFLGDAESPLLAWLRQVENTVIQTAEKITPEYIEAHRINFLVSYGYRHIIKKNVLDLLPAAAINLHISYLPWNKGADPNLWSIVEGSPKGVTIHYLDEGLDTGDIIVQEIVTCDAPQETLSSSYQILHTRIRGLFRQHWESIVSGQCPRQKQDTGGSVHKTKDKQQLLKMLTAGWETPLLGLEGRLSDS